MRKISKLLLSFIGASLAFGGVLPAFSSSNMLNASSSKTEYFNFGPGNFNPNSGQKIENFNSSAYSIAYRNGALMLFPNLDLYASNGMGEAVSEQNLIDTNFDLVRIYTSSTNYYTLSSVMRASSPVAYNIYMDACQNVSIFLRDGALAAIDIYKIQFSEGFTLPYPGEDHSTKYVLGESIEFAYTGYKSKTDVDIIWSTDWVKSSIVDEKQEEKDDDEIEIVPIAAFTRKDDEYRLHIRGYIVEWDDDLISQDDGTARLFIFFGEDDYNSEFDRSYNINVNQARFDLSESKTSYLTNLYDLILFHTEDGKTLTLREVSNPFAKGLPIYNSWGERGCICFDIGNIYAPSETSYCATSFSAITIKKGAQFPDCGYTNGGALTEKRYEQIDDITVNLSMYRKALWCTSVEYAFNAADIEITSLNARNVSIHDDLTDIEGASIDIGMSESNYSGSSNAEITTIGDDLLRYVYINGRSIYRKYGMEDIKAYANLDGLENTLSIIIPGLDVSTIDELIVQRAASIPSLVASKAIMEFYGGYVSYYVLSSRLYFRSGDGFIESPKIKWTLWFDGANPIKVSNNSYFDFDDAPIGESTNTKKFIEWLDENGEPVAGLIKITSGKEYFGSYETFYLVKLQGLDKNVETYIQSGYRLTLHAETKNYAIPVKNGYIFQGWIDEDGQHYNFDNRVKRDMVITATWLKNDASLDNVDNNPIYLIILIGVAVAAVAIIAVDVVLLIKRKK